MPWDARSRVTGCRFSSWRVAMNDPSAATIVVDASTAVVEYEPDLVVVADDVEELS